MTLTLHNTLTRRKESFEPADPQRVTMYVCGPTVYNRAHIGNARPAVVFDVLHRLLRHLYGAEHVVYARNITDIDDKINKAAADQGVPISAITGRFEQHYLEDMGALGVLAPTHAPHATAHIAGIIDLIGQLIARGHAYEAQGHVLFSVPSFPAYGGLSRRSQDELIAGARVDVAPYKRDAADFVLWKPSTPDLPGWDSPWGRGRPGWHIECSAMIASVFGQATIDIHGGGQDLIFPHHENEIAQSAGAHGGAALARFWLHNGFVNMGRDKMSKSLGNIVTVQQLLEQGHKGEVLRLALLSAHYRQPLEWTDELIEREKNRLEGFYAAIRQVRDVPLVSTAEVPKAVLEALSDDLNTPEVLSALGDVRRSLTTATTLHERADAKSGLVAAMALLGFNLVSAGGGHSKAHPDGGGFGKHGHALNDPQVAALVVARIAAKAAKNWTEADRIRDELKAMGVVLEDRKDGTTDWRWA